MEQYLQYAVGGLLSLLVAVGGHFMRTLMQRLAEVERELPLKVTEEQTRQIVSDKIDPLREDIGELKAKLDRIVDLLLTRKN